MKNPKNLFPLVILAVALVALPAWAEEAAEETDHAEMKGIELYRSLCKPCHLEDSDAGEYTPMSLIMEQWDEFYDGIFVETHGEIPAPGEDAKMVPDLFDKDMIKKLRKFCVDHAADSEQPMTCG
jgi:hypothetical protein